MSFLAHSVVAPFSQISLCLSCDFVTDAIGDRCPHCGYRGLMNLKKAFVATRHQHVFDSEHGVEHGQLKCRCGEGLEIQLAKGATR